MAEDRWWLWYALSRWWCSCYAHDQCNHNTGVLHALPPRGGRTTASSAAVPPWPVESLLRSVSGHAKGFAEFALSRRTCRVVWFAERGRRAPARRSSPLSAFWPPVPAGRRVCSSVTAGALHRVHLAGSRECIWNRFSENIFHKLI